MNRAFWRALPPSVELEVEVFPNARQQREAYPPPHRYLEIGWDGAPLPAPAVPGLLVGDTPVTETLGLDWPLRFLAPRLAAFEAAGLPVARAGRGCGAARLARSARPLPPRVRARAIVDGALGRCRERLVGLGVPAERVAGRRRLGLAPRDRGRPFTRGRAQLTALGRDAGRPLLLANVVNEIWGGQVEDQAGPRAGARPPRA